MPNKLASWNSLIRCGNPTRSIPVNELIKAVKKKEVRKQGKQSAAVRMSSPTLLLAFDHALMASGATRCLHFAHSSFKWLAALMIVVI
jgi:hypothetical protein